MPSPLNVLLRAGKAVGRSIRSQSGNLLAYVVLVMVIFGFLGALMVSLFGTSLAGSAEANARRRAVYLSESGLRYGMSELRNGGFSESRIDALNDTVFKLDPAGEFELNIFTAWFESASKQSIGPNGSGTIAVSLPKGKVPAGLFPAEAPSGLYLVHCDYIDEVHPVGEQNPPAPARVKITGFTSTGADTLEIAVDDSGDGEGFYAEKKVPLCLAVKPDSDWWITPFTNIGINRAAAGLFPRSDGAIEINRRPLFYKRAIDRGSYLELVEVSFAPWDPLYASPQEQIRSGSDYVILAPRNYVVLSKGRSGEVESGGDMATSANVARRDPGGLPPDLGPQNLVYSDDATGDFRRVASSDIFRLDPETRSMRIGGNSSPGFGALWFRDTRDIGGIREFCNAGKCRFGTGFRAFFTLELDLEYDGDGLVFAVANASGTIGGQYKNDTASVGGDFESSELLGYAGDSRLVAEPATAPADNNPDYLDKKYPYGILPPKFGLEFDTKKNHDAAFESGSRKCFCGPNIDNTAIILKADTRNDPDESRHMAHFVFWSDDETLDDASCYTAEPPMMPFYPSGYVCRDNKPIYKDNRHHVCTSFTGNDPKNLREKYFSSRSKTEMVSKECDGTERYLAVEELDSDAEWLRGSDSALRRQWAIRLEVERSGGGGDLTLKAWFRQCGDNFCSNLIGQTFFADTRIAYPQGDRPADLLQNVSLSAADIPDFETFIFGFTTAIQQTQSKPITIRNLQLSFIRANDPAPKPSPFLPGSLFP